MKTQVSVAPTLALPAFARKALEERGIQAVERYHRQFDMARLRVRIKPDGPQVLCNAQLVTELRRYNAAALAWDPHTAVQEAMTSISTQVAKQHNRARA